MTAGAAWAKLGIVTQDRTFRAELERRARIEPELLRQPPSQVLVGLERLGLATGAIQRSHQLTPQPLSQRVLAHERLELRDELSRPAHPEL